MLTFATPEWARLLRAAACWATAVVCLSPGPGLGDDAVGDTPTDETVFFAFDDENLAWQHNLKLTLEPAKKHPDNPVLRCGPEGSPDYGHAVLYGTVLRIGGKFRMWYLGMIQREIVKGQAPGLWRPMCYAESDDGVHWIKPQLGLVDLGGNKRNNICLVESEIYSMTRVDDFLSVIHDPADPDPERRYKCAFIAHMPAQDIRGGMSHIGIEERLVCALVTATSADGLRWKCVGDRPANAGGERFEVSGLYRFGNYYYASGQCASPWTWLIDGRDVGRSMYTFRSADFLHWSKAKVLSMVLLDQITQPQPSYQKLLEGSGRQLHMGLGIWNRGNVLVGVHGIWQGIPPDRKLPIRNRLEGLKIDLGLAISTDGVHFHEPVPNFKLIEHGAIGQWDSIALLQGHAFVNQGDQTFLWYSHWDCEGEFRNQEIGLATMRRDGFGYLSRKDPGDPGHCVTSALTAGPRGAKVILNVAGATKDAPLLVEVLDDFDRPVDGFAGDKAARVIADGVRTAVWWPGRDWLPADRKFTLRVTLPDNDQARLYAIYVQNAP